MSRVLLALLVCLLALSLTEAVDRKALHSLRLRSQRDGPVIPARDDMQAAEERFQPIKRIILKGLADVDGDSALERKFYANFAANLLATLERELGLNLRNLDSPNLSLADLQLASKVAYLGRHELRVATRDHQSARSCANFLRWFAELRDRYEYGNKDGPTYAYLFNKNLKEMKVDIKVATADNFREVAKRILESSTRTNSAVNKALGIEIGKEPSPLTANDDPLLVLPAISEEANKLSPPPKNFKVDVACPKSDRVLAQVYAKELALPMDQAINLYDDEQQAKSDDKATKKGGKV